MIADSASTPRTEVSTPNLAARISESLFQSGYAALRFVTVIANGGVVTLKGRVPSFYLKQVAQHRAIRVPGALLVENQLVVD